MFFVIGSRLLLSCFFFFSIRRLHTRYWRDWSSDVCSSDLPLIQGALMHKAHGDVAWDMPPFRRIQDSGIRWGLGTDATAVTTSNPFYTLAFAVTGRMIGGRKVNRQSITREEALIAHTRSNAFIVFQEANLGSLQPGKYADLLVLDRDYLNIPADSIKDIKPVMTMVGGKIVYQRSGA